MRNAVKATVDAYDGTVNLYAWDETDPMLRGLARRLPRHGPGPGRHPRLADGAPALPRGPVQGAALPVRALPRHRPRRLLPEQRPVGGPGGPVRPRHLPAAVPALRRRPDGRPATRPGRSPRSTCRATRTTWRRSSRSTPTRPTTSTARSGRSSCPNEQTPGPGLIANEMANSDNVRARAAGLQPRRDRARVRQPADAAGRRRADVRPAGLRRARSSPRPATRSCSS